MVRFGAFFLGLLGALVASSEVSADAMAPEAAADERRTLGCILHRTDFWNAERAMPLGLSLPVMMILLALSGFFTCLTLGLMSMDVIGLEMIERGDDAELSSCARCILGVRKKNPNQLMCTLMLGNVASNAILTILAADALTLSYGLCASIVLTLLFGEMLPQAMISRHTLQVGARLVPIAHCLVMLLYVFTKPMAMVLRLGRKEMGTVRTRTELMERLQLRCEQHQEAAMAAADETAKKVAEGALQFRNRTVKDVMTPLEDAYMLPQSTRLGYTTIRAIFETGFTRIPVYGSTKNEYKGLLVTKDLMLADPEDEMKLGDFICIFNRNVETVHEDTQLVEVLNKFKKGGTHMGLVRQVNVESDFNPHYEIRGVVTLEDVIEEILQDEIVDETDVYQDVDNHVKILDGREKRELNLAVFNPLWKSKKERLEPEEVRAISSFLDRVCFAPELGDLTLSIRAIGWLVAKCGVQNRTRVTPPGTEEIQEEDLLYETGKEANKCILVVQGRVGIRAGRDHFRSEVGAFSILARDALRPGHIFVSDYSAFLLTSSVRLVHISKVNFLEALVLDRNKEELTQAIAAQAAEQAGEVAVDSSSNVRRTGPGETEELVREIDFRSEFNDHLLKPLSI